MISKYARLQHSPLPDASLLPVILVCLSKFCMIIIYLNALMIVSGLQHAAWWLVIAEKDYMVLQLYRSVLDVQYLLAVVYNSMGAEQERDASAQRFKTTQQLVEDLEASVADAETGAILDMVSRVGILEFEGSNKLEA